MPARRIVVSSLLEVVLVVYYEDHNYDTSGYEAQDSEYKD